MINVGVNIQTCRECEKCNKGVEIYKLFEWGNKKSIAIDFDKETNEIVVFEEFLMHIIKMINPLQLERKIRIESKKDYYSKANKK